MNLVSGRCWIKVERSYRGQGCLMAAARWGVNALSIEIFFFFFVGLLFSFETLGSSKFGFSSLFCRLAFTMKVIMVVFFLCSGFEKILI